MLGYIVALASVLLVCMAALFGYHLIAGNLNPVTFVAVAAMSFIAYRMFRRSVTDYRKETSISDCREETSNS